MYLKEDDITDINMIDEYNDDYKRMYPDFKPFVTKENLICLLLIDLEYSTMNFIISKLRRGSPPWNSKSR